MPTLAELLADIDGDDAGDASAPRAEPPVEQLLDVFRMLTRASGGTVSGG